ncbi:MAG: hypothetical protein LBQ38_08090 [Spirochaetaceae bacterium]|jgi:hypothetical protein|nr:hypothetical protein [Spirochaetaceae bacterium]
MNDLLKRIPLFGIMLTSIVTVVITIAKWNSIYENCKNVFNLLRKAPSVLNENIAQDSSLSNLFKGLWIGTYKQNFSGELQSFKITIRITNKGKKLNGVLHVLDDSHPINCFGYAYQPRILAMSYSVYDYKRYIRHGFSYAELSSDSKKLKGYFIGYGYKSGKIVHGSVLLDKSDED